MTEKKTPQISFGIIVLNSDPFIYYNLKSLYPFAHEIIVVEGAVRSAANIATPDGHSRDTTLNTLQNFKANHDPENKLQVITKKSFWSEKDEMSKAYAQKATGNYLWQVDADEFYKADDIRRIIKILAENPTITAISFKTITFWGAPHYIADSWYLRRGAAYYHRLFKWGEGYTYVTHRPPTVYDHTGTNVRDINWIPGQEIAKLGIYMYHYSLLLPKQVYDKCDYYSKAEWAEANEAQIWADETYARLKKPFRVHNVYQYPSWLERYKGNHPAQIQQMWYDINQPDSQIVTRQNDDVEKLLSNPIYRIKRFGIKYADYIVRMRHSVRQLRWRIIKRLSQMRNTFLSKRKV